MSLKKDRSSEKAQNMIKVASVKICKWPGKKKFGKPRKRKKKSCFKSNRA